MSGRKLKIHLEGMGLYGCMIATMLRRYNIPFTWNDTATKHTAWKASTGCIYPGGSEKFGPDEPCRAVWARWHYWGDFGTHLERSNFIFNHKTNPPHKGKYNVTKTTHGLKVAEPHSYHLNAQSFVPAVRDLYEDWRVDRTPRVEDVDFYIRAHGFGARLSHAYWGWTRRVKLKYNEEYTTRNVRPCFYFRDGRFIMTYAYPIAGTPWWYAGSSIIKQKLGKFKSLEMQPKYDRWHHHFLRLGKGAVEIIDEGDFIEGWRPATEDEHWITSKGGVLSIRPLWNSGIRHFPKQWSELSALLGININPEEAVK